MPLPHGHDGDDEPGASGTGATGRRRPTSGRPTSSSSHAPRGPRPRTAPRPASATSSTPASGATSGMLIGGGTSAPAFWQSALRGISCERISEVDEEEVSDTVLSRPSSSSTPGAGGTSSPSATSSLDEGEIVDDGTLADLSTVSTLSEGTSDGDLYWGRDQLAELAALAEDVLGEDEHLDEAATDRGFSTDLQEDPDDESTTGGGDTLLPSSEWGEGGGEGTDGENWRLEVVGLGCVLDDAVDQLCILAHTSRAAKLAPGLSNQSLNERLEAIDARETERRNSVIPGLRRAMDDEEDNAQVDKIQRDRAMVQEALRLQQLWLCLLCLPQWSCESLLESPLCRLVREEERRATEEAVMLVDSAKGAGRADVLRSKGVAEEQEARRQLRAMREERTQLQEEARSLRARAALGAAITGRWERARLQQHERHLQAAEQGLDAALRHVQDDYRLELRAHAELVEYLHQATQSLELESEEWQARYDEVTAGWDAKLAALKVERQEHTRQLRAVRKELARRERFKRDFLAYKAARDHQIEERIRFHNAATRIQSWWRMTMVRKGLGPWKRMAKKKKKKKK